MSVHLQKIHVVGVRNLKHQSVELSPGLNVLLGANGSGKTSLLEAVSLLGLGRSFRTSSARSLIQHGADHCLVQGRVIRSGQQHALGIQRYRNGAAQIRVDGSNAQSLTSLAELLPVVLLDTNSVDLVTGAPEGRRRFLDGTLFHVEQGFLSCWRAYQRALRQRNAGLRRGTLASDEGWRREMARAGEVLTRIRQEWVERLAAKTQVLGKGLSPSLQDLTLQFRPGWDVQRSLLSALDERLVSDRQQGFSQTGPHRAEVKILVGGRPASEVLSRGQLKLAVTALKLSQGQLLADGPAGAPLYLVDDISAELDADHSLAVCALLASSDAQIILTSASQSDLERLWPLQSLALFHVEQGGITARPAGTSP